MQINEVYTVTATAEPDVFLFSCNITDDVPETYDCDYCSRPNDPYGLGPAFRQWLVDNPDFPIGPYVPPTIEELRADAVPLNRLIFRQKLLEIGIKQANVQDYLNSITDPMLNEAATIYWTEAMMFERLSEFVTGFAAYAGITDAQLDEMWGIGGKGG